MGKRTPAYTAGGVETGGVTVEVSAEAPQKTKHRTAMTQLSHSQ